MPIQNQYHNDEKILYAKHFGFLAGHSTDHAIAKLSNQIHDSLEKNYYTLNVFIDLSKAFDTVAHSILLKEPEIYGIKNSNLS